MKLKNLAMKESISCNVYEHMMEMVGKTRNDMKWYKDKCEIQEQTMVSTLLAVGEDRSSLSFKRGWAISEKDLEKSGQNGILNISSLALYA